MVEDEMMITLVTPDLKYQHPYMEMIHEWKASGEELAPWVLKLDYSDFTHLVNQLNSYSRGDGVPESFVPSSTFWGYEIGSDKIVGAINIRHSLNEALLHAWGNIGYGVRPSQRRKGYATQMLRLALEECKRLTADKVLLGCFKENIASAKTILANGGVLENEIVDEGTGKIIQRYWITLKTI